MVVLLLAGCGGDGGDGDAGDGAPADSGDASDGGTTPDGDVDVASDSGPTADAGPDDGGDGAAGDGGADGDAEAAGEDGSPDGGDGGEADAGPDGDADGSPVEAGPDADADGGSADAGPDAEADSGSAEAGPDADGDAAWPDGGSDGGTVDGDVGDAEPVLDVPVVGGDLVLPRVWLEQGPTQDDPTSDLPIRFDAIFDEPIDLSTIDISDFVIEPDLPMTAELVDFGDGMTFQVQLIFLADVDATYEVTLPYGRVTDLAGNPNEESSSIDNRVRYDVTLPTVEVRKYPPLVEVTNSLPFDFQVVFQVTVDPATFTVDDIVNGGTATGVEWSIEEWSPGYTYRVWATAVATTGTVFPVIVAGAATSAVTSTPTLESVYIGAPVTYTPLPILVVDDDDAPEGGTLLFRARFPTTRSSEPTLFDWTTVDGTALDGVDYVASSGTDVTIPANGASVTFPVSAIPDDDLPEPHKQLTVVLSNVRGPVYVHDDTAVGTIVNDDRGYWSFGANDGSNLAARPTDIRLSSDDIHIFGEPHDWTPKLVRRDLASGSVEQNLIVGGEEPGGLAMNVHGYYFATNVTDGGYTLSMFDHATDTFASAFGSSGQVQVSDATDSLWAVDLAADDSGLYVVGTRTDPSGDSQWLVEARDPTDGSLLAGFGDGGVLLLDRLTGAAEETPVTARSDGTHLYVLGRVGDAYQVEKRSLLDGSLDGGFADGGVLQLFWLDEAADVAVYDSKLYVLGRDGIESSVVRVEASDGSPEWIGFPTMDDPECITVDETGIYLGGAREEAMHIERWMHDGSPVWARTFEVDKAPAAITGIAVGPDGGWLHSVGYHTWGGDRDWYYERRGAAEGLTYWYEPGEPPE